MGLLGRAKTMMQAWSAAPPARAQSYTVACAEGHRLKGQRTEGYQALRCPTCGDGIFVLPRSPLPDPPIPASSNPSRVAAAIDAFPDDGPVALSDPPVSGSGSGSNVLDPADQGEAEIDWVEEASESTPVESRLVPPSIKPAAPPRPRPPQPPKQTPARAQAPVVVLVARPTVREWALRNRNKLLPVGVVLIVLAAVAIRQRRQWLEGLPQVAEIGRTEGLKALDLGEFQVAKKILTEAATAVKALGGRYEGGDSIQQGALEAAIFTDLTSESLEAIVEEAATYREANDWSSHFAGYYKGRSIILETAISAVPESNKPGSTYQIGYRVYTGRGPLPKDRGRVDLKGFRLFELATPKVGEQKIFGARMASLEYDLVDKEWVLTLEPESGVFMTHPRALQSIGWPRSDALEEDKP